MIFLGTAKAAVSLYGNTYDDQIELRTHMLNTEETSFVCRYKAKSSGDMTNHTEKFGHDPFN